MLFLRLLVPVLYCVAFWDWGDGILGLGGMGFHGRNGAMLEVSSSGKDMYHIGEKKKFLAWKSKGESMFGRAFLEAVGRLWRK